jgi:hypothetical protein
VKYLAKGGFMVPASAGSKETCDQVGHSMMDRHGKCVRCGEQLAALLTSEARVSNALFTDDQVAEIHRTGQWPVGIPCT